MMIIICNLTMIYDIPSSSADLLLHLLMTRLLLLQMLLQMEDIDAADDDMHLHDVA